MSSGVLSQSTSLSSWQQSEVSLEVSCVVQEDNEAKSSVKMSSGVMSQSTGSLSTCQESEVSLEGERREMMLRVSSGANTGVVDPAVRTREEDIRNVVEILLSPRNRNALLIGDTAVGANSVVEDLAFRLKVGLVPMQLARLQFLDPKLSLSSISHCSSLQMERRLAELSKIVEECMPNGAILHIGDLLWLAELKESPRSNFCTAQRTAAKLGNLLARHARLWFVGVVTPHSFARLQILHPTISSDWKLQSVQVKSAFQFPQTTLPQRFLSNLSLTDQQALNTLPVRGSSPLSSRYFGKTQATQMSQCCADCFSKFEEERRQLRENQSLALQLAPNKWFPCNDEVPSGGPNEAMSQMKNPPAVQQAVAQLLQKWQKLCRMHHGEASPVPTRAQQLSAMPRYLDQEGFTAPQVHMQQCMGLESLDDFHESDHPHSLIPETQTSGVIKKPNLDQDKPVQKSIQDFDHRLSNIAQPPRRGSRYSILNRTELNVLDDGFKWRKYKQEAVRNNPHPRNCYKCTTPKCPVQKLVERSAKDLGLLKSTYVGMHTHPSPMALDSSHISKSIIHFPQASGIALQRFETSSELVHQSLGLMHRDLHQDEEGYIAPQVHMHLLNKEDVELSKARGHYSIEENPLSFKDNIVDISNDDIMCNDEFISLVKKRMEAMTSIQIIDYQEAFSKNHSFDNQATIVLGLFNAASNNLEFYFESGESMAKLVGVGLHHAKVIVKLGITFEVQEIEMEKCEKLWHEVKEGSSKECKIMKVRLPQISGTIKSGDLGEGRNVATSSSPINQDHYTSMASLQVPCLWEISKFFIMDRVIDASHTKCDNIMWNESIEAQCMDNYPKDGNEANMTWYRSLKVLFSRGASNQNDNNQRQEEMDQGKGHGNGNGNGGDGDSPRGVSSIDMDVQDIETFAQVNVILLSGGDFFEKNLEPLSNHHRHPISIERLENVKVTPELTFGFHKSRESKKIQITTSVVFALDLDCDSIESCPHSMSHGHESCGHFGWFHDELYESLGPIDQHIQRTAYLKHDFKEGDYVVGKTTSKASTSKDIIKGKEKSYQTTLVVGNSQVARVVFGANMKQQASCMDHEGNEQSLERNCNLTEGGFKIQAKHMMHLALLQYKYLPPYIDIIAEQVQEQKYRYDLINHPVCNLQKTQFSGTWLPTGNNEVATYAFKANRKLHEIQIEEETLLTSGSSGFKTLFKKRNREYLEVYIRSSLEPPLTQAYEKQLYVNHAMSHLVDGHTYTLIESSQPQNSSAALIQFPILVDYQ